MADAYPREKRRRYGRRPTRRQWVAGITAAIVLGGFAGAAVKYHDDAAFWECNAARRANQYQNYRLLSEVDAGTYTNSAEFEREIDREMRPPERDRADVHVVLREPKPGGGCWSDGEWYRTEGKASRVVER